MQRDCNGKIGLVNVQWKSGSKDDYSNYRPITLLPVPSKITDSVICGNIVPYLGKYFKRTSGGIRNDFPLNLS